MNNKPKQNKNHTHLGAYWHQLMSFARKEFIHIRRDPRSLLILLVMPILMVLLPGYIVKNDVTDIRLAVIDQSHDECTRQLTERMAQNEYFSYTGHLNTEAEATEMFRRGQVDLVLVYGPEFGNRLLHTHDASIQILSDGSEPNQGSVRVAYAQGVIMSFQKEMAHRMMPQGAGSVHTQPAFSINTTTRMLYNPQQRSEVNFVPGIVGLIMLLICCMMTSVAIVREREMGTMEILLASPLPPMVIVVAKLVPYLILSLINLSTILCITNFVMDIPMVGSMWAYLLVALVYVFTCLMLGLFISTCVDTQLAAMLLSLLLIVPGMYLSGMIFSVESMPQVAQVMSNIVPTKWFVVASRKIMIEGVELQYVLKDVGILLAEGIVLLLLSWKLFKTRLE